MVTIRVLRELSDSDRDAVRAFLHEVHALDGTTLGDHLRADLEQGPRPGFVAAVAHHDGTLAGYAQATSGNEGFVVDAIVGPRPGGEGDRVRAALLSRLLAELPPDTGVTWWTDGGEAADALARALHLRPGRALLQMRRALPLGRTTDVVVRPFRVGLDEAAWLEVNNAAFAWHGEQGGWDLATLHQREREPWFSAEGFLLHEREGRLAAFCWTKLHPPAGPHLPVVGEIYVIAVHPDFHGTGLGAALTIAGLQHLHAVGATEAMLYVDASNESAIRLYDQLGFQVAHTDQAFIRLPGGSST